MADMSALLARFGLGEHAVVNEFTTDMGVPKSVIRTAQGVEWFVGSLSPTWPGLGHLNTLLPLLNRLARSLDETQGEVRIGHYLQTCGGEYAALHGKHHHFVRHYFGGAARHPPAFGATQARALALFHQHGQIALHRAGPRYIRTRVVAHRYPQWILPQLCLPMLSRSGEGAATLVRPLAAQAARDANDFDRLPVYLTHDDYQPKNVLIGPAANSVAIIDIESGQLQSRLSDFYYFLMESEFGGTLGDFARFHRLLAAYFETAGRLTNDEARLLPFALQTKAAGIAAWAASQHRAASPERQSLFANWHAQALRCIRLIDAERQTLRDIAYAFIEAPARQRRAQSAPG